jgi:hypothetical protein
VREDVLDILDLVGCTAMQVGAPGQELGTFLLQGDFLGQLGQAELHILDGQVAGRTIVEVLERFGRALRLLALHREHRAAARDRHVERGLDLPEVLVERAAQAREALVVDRFQLDFDRFRPQTSSPLRL